MVNTTRKGYRHEKLIQDAYKNNGYQTYRSPNVRAGDNDIFNLWDLFVLNSKKVKLIQVKSEMDSFYKWRKVATKWLISNAYQSNSNLPAHDIDYECFVVLPKKLGGVRKYKWNYYNYDWVLQENNMFDVIR
jgi:hypothetical protein